jgi:hypothetical protein
MRKYLYIAGYKGKGMGSGFIKRFTFSRFSHVSIVFDMGNYGLEYESIQRKGVHKQTFVSDPDVELIRIPVTAAQEEWAVKLLESVLGAKYDWTGIWGFLVRKKREMAYKWFCSELVAWVCLTIGIVLQRLKAFQFTPGLCMCSPAGEPCEVPEAWHE